MAVVSIDVDRESNISDIKLSLMEEFELDKEISQDDGMLELRGTLDADKERVSMIFNQEETKRIWDFMNKHPDWWNGKPSSDG
jgi:hypothetical protein